MKIYMIHTDIPMENQFHGMKLTDKKFAKNTRIKT